LNWIDAYFKSSLSICCWWLRANQRMLARSDADWRRLSEREL
jgi:hypothetical protein